LLMRTELFVRRMIKMLVIRCANWFKQFKNGDFNIIGFLECEFSHQAKFWMRIAPRKIPGLCTDVYPCIGNINDKECSGRLAAVKEDELQKEKWEKVVENDGKYFHSINLYCIKFFFIVIKKLQKIGNNFCADLILTS